jgi:nitrate reductase gamma subunit
MRADLFFSTWPYIALSLLVVGIIVRYLLERTRMAAVREEMSEAWSLFGGAGVWRASVLLLVLGHAASLVFPQTILAWNGRPARLYLLEGIAFAAGIAAFAGCTALILRHLARTNRSAITELSDTVFIALVLSGILSGLLMAVFHRWGSSWGTLVLTPYITSLLKLRPTAGLAMQTPFLVRLHVFSMFAVFAVLPLTRLAAFLVFALHSTLTYMGRPISAAGHTAESWLRRHNPSAWLWPEED